MSHSKDDNQHSTAIIISRVLLFPALKNNRYHFWCQKSGQTASSDSDYLLLFLKPHLNFKTIGSHRVVRVIREVRLASPQRSTLQETALNRKKVTVNPQKHMIDT